MNKINETGHAMNVANFFKKTENQPLPFLLHFFSKIVSVNGASRNLKLYEVQKGMVNIK